MQDEGLCDEVKVSGLGLPSEMVSYTMNGCAPEFALWDFRDLGYLTYYVSYLLATGQMEAEVGQSFVAGRMGEYAIEEDPNRDEGLRVLMGPFHDLQPPRTWKRRRSSRGASRTGRGRAERSVRPPCLPGVQPAVRCPRGPSMSQPLLEMRGISKNFAMTAALSDLSMSLQPGEIHAVVGENGAGKSTLIKIMTGVHEPSSGEILVEGTPRTIRGPREAQALGIAAVYQEPMVFPDLDVAENIFIQPPRPRHRYELGQDLARRRGHRRQAGRLAGRPPAGQRADLGGAADGRDRPCPVARRPRC